MIESFWPDVAGPVEVSLAEGPYDFFTRNLVAVLVQQRFRDDYVVAGWIAVTRDVFAEGADWKLMVADALERIFRPWAWPDKNIMPTMDLFPRTARMLAHLSPPRVRSRLASARSFVVEGWRARHEGEPPR